MSKVDRFYRMLFAVKHGDAYMHMLSHSEQYMVAFAFGWWEQLPYRDIMKDPIDCWHKRLTPEQQEAALRFRKDCQETIV